MKKSVKILISALTLIVVCASCIALVACNTSSADGKQINMVNVELSSEQYAFIFKKSDDALKESVNAILESKKTQIDEIMSKYLNATGDELASFGSADIKTESSGSDNELVVATNLEFSPFEYRNGSKIAGIDIEIAQLIADELGKTLVVAHMDFDAVCRQWKRRRNTTSVWRHSQYPPTARKSSISQILITTRRKCSL